MTDFRPSFTQTDSNGLNYDFLFIRLTKDCIYNFEKTDSRKVSGKNREIEEQFLVTIFVVMDG